MVAKYALAKYVRDLDRQEPINIGIVAWTRGKAVAKFVEPEDSEFILDQKNYQRWLDYWTGLLGNRKIQVFRERPATVLSPRFFKQVLLTGNGNYRLVESGEIEEATVDNLPEAVRFLFSRLVHKTREHSEREPGLADRCHKFLEDAGLMMRDNFHRRYPLQLSIDGANSEVHYDYGQGEPDSVPDALMQRVNLSKEESVLLAAGKLGTAQKYGRIRINNCFTLYDSSLEPGETDVTRRFLKTFSIPLDIANREETTAQLQAVLSLSP